MNGFYLLVLAATIVGAVYWIPRAIRHDMLMAELEALDDQELTAALEAYPDLIEWRRK